MTITRLFASALLAAVSFGTMSAANAVVPGSDTYDRARDTAASQSVVEGSSSGASGTAAQSRSYGYPIAGATRSTRDLVPGSSVGDEAADGDAIMSVVTGRPQGTLPAAAGRTGRVVPGSDSF